MKKSYKIASKQERSLISWNDNGVLLKHTKKIEHKK
jgi:hypothetical protein